MLCLPQIIPEKATKTGKFHLNNPPLQVLGLKQIYPSTFNFFALCWSNFFATFSTCELSYHL